MLAAAPPSPRSSPRERSAPRRLRPRRPRRTAPPGLGGAGPRESPWRRRFRTDGETNVNASRHKLVWFVPEEALDATRDAVFAAGAGRIGDYERCSWYAVGTGTFLGGESTDPTIGQPGRDERVAELRLETIYPEEREADVVAALRGAHPYEEPAFDLYPLG